MWCPAAPSRLTAADDRPSGSGTAPYRGGRWGSSAYSPRESSGTPARPCSRRSIVGRVDAAEGQTAAEDVRPTQIQVDRVGGTQTAAKGNDTGQVVPAVALLGQAADLGHGLVHDVVQPLLHSGGCASRGSPLVSDQVSLSSVSMESTMIWPDSIHGARVSAMWKSSKSKNRPS